MTIIDYNILSILRNKLFIQLPESKFGEGIAAGEHGKAAATAEQYPILHGVQESSKAAMLSTVKGQINIYYIYI